MRKPVVEIDNVLVHAIPVIFVCRIVVQKSAAVLASPAASWHLTVKLYRFLELKRRPVRQMAFKFCVGRPQWRWVSRSRGRSFPAVAARRFPMDVDLLLDAQPMKGSKRVPIVEIDEDGTAIIDLWCDRVEGAPRFPAIPSPLRQRHARWRELSRRSRPGRR